MPEYAPGTPSWVELSSADPDASAAFFADPTGAVFGGWQPKSFSGADLVNEPGSLCWNEVLTRDSEADKRFYPAVFGWDAGRPTFEGAPDTYVVWELGGKPVGGMMQMNEAFPA